MGGLPNLFGGVPENGSAHAVRTIAGASTMKSATISAARASSQSDSTNPAQLKHGVTTTSVWKSGCHGS